MARSLGGGSQIRTVLAISSFRRLWISLTLSSLGDWLGLLATTALAGALTTGFAAQSYAIGGVLVVRLLPALLLAPLAGAFADRFDRRAQMVIADVARCGLYISIPVVGSLGWLLAATFLIEAVSLFWIPAKEASVPRLVGRHQLEPAYQISLISTYGSAAPAAVVFILLSKVNTAVFETDPVSLALYFDAATFLVSALTILSLRELGVRPKRTGTAGDGERARALERVASVFTDIRDGWRFAGTNPVVRGLIVGILGACTGAGAVVATGRLFVGILGGGNAAYGVLFADIFVGLVAGMGGGPRLLVGLSRRRLFGVAIFGAGTSLAVCAFMPNLLLVLLLVFFVGAFAGVAWVVGYSVLGHEVADELRGRTFALVQSMFQLDLLLTLAVAPFVVGAIGQHHAQLPTGGQIRLDGVTLTLFGAGIVTVALGLLAYRLMDDRPGVPLWRDMLASVRRHASSSGQTAGGCFVAFEGGEGAGKSTQVALLAEWLAAHGRDVVVTREPGATEAGQRIRALLLDPTAVVSPRAEALLYAADRADHVAGVIRPALARAAVVVTDRYVDSSLAYQGAGRKLDEDEVVRLSRWATGGLTPDLTVLLDLPAEVGLARARARAATDWAGGADRIEGQSVDFHERVRRAFRACAEEQPERYLVLDAGAPPDRIAATVRERVAALLDLPTGWPDPVVPAPASVGPAS